MPDARPLKAMICDPDAWSRRATIELVEEAGFEVIGESENAVEALHQNDYLHPTLIVMTHEHTGLSGLEAIPDLHRAEEPPEVILISLDDTARDRAKEAGAFELAVKGDNEMLERMLKEVRELLETGERRKSSDRRTGDDRRKAQDWSKVISERRTGDDRRGNLRREKDVTSKAKDALSGQQADPDGS